MPVIRRIGALMCAAALVFALAVAFSATVFAADGDKYDNFHHGSESNVTLDAVDIVRAYIEELGEDLSKAEEDFLSEFATLEFTYSTTITTDKVDLAYDSAAGSLTVSAKEYTYGDSGNSFTWAPVSVTFLGREHELSLGSAVIEEVAASSLSEPLTVKYASTEKIERADIDAVVNLYRDTAKYIFDTAEYEKNTVLYEKYVREKRIYDDLYAKYEKYLAEYDEYLKDVAAYDKYKSDLKTYESDYAKYNQYLSDVDAYELAVKQYATFLENREIVKKQLAAVELVKVKMTDGRSLYDAVMGGTVDEVLENETVLTDVLNVDGKVVAMAGDATERVRALMVNYYAEKTEKDRYNYYIVNYDNFCESFLELTQSLDKLYRYKKVRGTLIAEKKDKKYIILVAQLALVTNALIDDELYDYDGNLAYNSSWKIEDKTIKTILENKEYYTDEDGAAPLDTGYPEDMNEPVLPDEVACPTLPTEPDIPIEPDTVESPGEAPEEVALPDRPVLENPLAAAVLRLLDESEAGELSLAYSSGACPGERLVDEDYTPKLYTYVKRTYTAKTYNLEFFSESGDVLYTVTVEEGTAAVYEGLPQSKEEDEYYSYELDGWQTADGTRVALGSINSNAELYPCFKKAPKYYNVTWVVAGESVTQRMAADTIPECPIPLELPESASCYYEFAGWDTPIEPVGRNITYTAIFDEKHIVPYADRGATIYDDGVNVVCDASNHYTMDTEPLNISALLDRIGGRRSLTLKTVRGDIDFTFTDVISLQDSGAETLRIVSAMIGSTSNTFKLLILDTNGEECCTDLMLSCSLYHKVGDYKNAKLKVKGDAGYDAVKASIEEGKMSFTMVPGREYMLAPVYSVTVYDSEGATVTVSYDSLDPGALIKLTVKYAEGYEAREFSIINEATGENIAYNGASFRMPRGNVSVYATAKLKVYTVTFVSDGKVISSAQYNHGDSVKLPADPKKESDGKRTYAFVGWSPSVSPTATESVTYKARYQSTLLPMDDDEDEIKISDKVKKLIAAAGAAVVLVVLGAVPCLILSLVCVKRLKKDGGVPNKPPQRRRKGSE